MARHLRSGRRSIALAGALLAGLFLALPAGPILAAPSTFDWDAHDWPSESLSETYSGIGSPATDLTFTFSGDTNRFTNNSPDTNQTLTGGLSPAQDTLFSSFNFSSASQSITLTIDLSLPASGVSLVVFDIDRDTPASSGTEHVTISALDSQGSPVLPALTAADPACVSFTGNTANGLC
ncbi:MAG TPA: hypothetical protein VJ768_02655, partial [Anaerolineales bacterium]|nr:hypothetical protein [Anaerolineales bacterium]